MAVSLAEKKHIRAVTHINFNLYHYAGNNPVKYVDPTGQFDFDTDNGIIYCDLSNPEDIKLASTQFVLNENRGFSTCIAQDSESGLSVQFNDSESMVNFVSENCYSKDYAAAFENFVDTIGSLTTLGDSAGLPNLSKISTGLGIISIAIDANKFSNNPDYSGGIDLGLDAAGLIGGIVGSTTLPIACIYLSCVKTEVDFFTKTMADFNVEFNSMAEQYINDKLMDEYYGW